MQTISYVSLILTYLIFIFFGYKLSKKITKPLGIFKWVLLVLATLLSYFFIIGRIIDVFNFVIQVNWCLQGFGIGVITGLLVKSLKSKLAAGT